MYKDSCCAQATMQSVNAFSRETLAASASCQAGRNKVYQKKGKKGNFYRFFPIFSPAFCAKGEWGPQQNRECFPGGSHYPILVVGVLNVPCPSHFLQQSHIIPIIKQRMVRNRERVTKAAFTIDQKKIKQQNVDWDVKWSHKTRKDLPYTEPELASTKRRHLLFLHPQFEVKVKENKQGTKTPCKPDDVFLPRSWNKEGSCWSNNPHVLPVKSSVVIKRRIKGGLSWNNDVVSGSSWRAGNRRKDSRKEGR